jgi:O-antigen ligase
MRPIVFEHYPSIARLASENGSAQSLTTGAERAVEAQRLTRNGVSEETLAVKPVLQWAFWLFIFSISFESMDLGFGQGIVSLSKIFGYLFVPFALTQPRVCFRSLPRAFWCFTLYIVVCLVLGILQGGEYWPMALVRLLQLCQMLVLFCIAYNLMRSDEIVRGTLLVLGVSCSVFALLQMLGVGTVGLRDGISGVDRMSTLGTGANTAGATYALALLALIGCAYGRRESGRKAWLLTWPLCGLIATQLVATGSRSAGLAFGVGLLAFLVKPGSLWLRFRAALIILLAIGAFLWISSHSKLFEKRWEATVTTGTMAGREKIFPTAWQMFLERPLTGWGPARHIFELGSRMGRHSKARGTHNLYLWVLTETGLVGAIPLFLGLCFCLRMAWKARQGRQGVLPLALLMALLTVNTTADWDNRKLHWLVLAYALAGGSHFTARRRRGAVGPAARPSDRLSNLVYRPGD